MSGEEEEDELRARVENVGKRVTPSLPACFAATLRVASLRVYFALCMTGGQFELERSGVEQSLHCPWPSDGERERVALASGQVMFLELARDFPLSRGEEGGHETCSFG